MGRLVKVTDPLNNSNRYTYDAVGNLLTTTDASERHHPHLRHPGPEDAMSDPDMGRWTYSYNALGELNSQTDAKSQTVTMSYDALGRMTSRTEAEGTTSWTYDTAVKGKGKLHRVAGPGRVRAHPQLRQSGARAGRERDDLRGDLPGQPELRRIRAGGDPELPQGRVRGGAEVHGDGVSQVGVQGGYARDGVLEGGGGERGGADHRGDVGERSGDDPELRRGDGSGPEHPVGGGESSAVQDLGYRFDSLGNLTTREDFNQDVYESFAYDRLNRLTGGIVYDADDDTERESKTYRYDAVGNIVNKSDVGTADYVYGTGNAAGAGDAGPHAVVSAGGNSYAYDDNGNMISGDGRTLTWTSFNKPKTVVNGTTHTRFDYGPERARTRQVKVQGANTTTIKYVGTLFEQVGEDRGGDRVRALRVCGREAGSGLRQGQCADAERGGAVPAPGPPGVGGHHHGRERRGGGAAVVRCVGEAADGVGGGCLEGLGDPDHGGDHARGFTDHEHLDDFELVHMNGRVYEPVLGRFLSPDPFVQYPESTQGFNRYTYAANNPLSFTDPTGYWLDNLDEDDEIYDDDDWNAYDWGDDLSTDDEGGIGGLDDWGQSTPVSNPATGQPVPTSSGSPQGVNQAGHGGGDRRGMFSDYWDDMRELQRVTVTLGYMDMEIQERLTQSPLPGRRLNVRDPATHTADGRFDRTGSLGYRGGRHHLGVDIAAPVGTDVMAAGDGRAVTRTAGTYGVIVEIYHGGGIVTRYAHLDSVTFSDKPRVAAGDIIGTVGTTGNVPPTASPHLHFEVISNDKRVDPSNYFDWRQ